jgi:hypothetical protein
MSRLLVGVILVGRGADSSGAGCGVITGGVTAAGAGSAGVGASTGIEAAGSAARALLKKHAADGKAKSARNSKKIPQAEFRFLSTIDRTVAPITILSFIQLSTISPHGGFS